MWHAATHYKPGYRESRKAPRRWSTSSARKIAFAMNSNQRHQSVYFFFCILKSLSIVNKKYEIFSEKLEIVKGILSQDLAAILSLLPLLPTENSSNISLLPKKNVTVNSSHCMIRNTQKKRLKIKSLPESSVNVQI